MSFRKLDQTFPKNNFETNYRNISKKISKILVSKAPQKHGAIKKLSNLTGTEIHTLKKWYNGSSSPDLANFINLARHIPEFIELFLELCQYPEIWEIYKNHQHLIDIINKDAKIIKYEESYSDIFSETHVTINFSIIKKLPDTLNKRQKWFLQELRSETKIDVLDLSEKWSVSIRTAKRDIRDMKERGLIYFSGSRKYGKYYTK
jgi:hypothetical protein